MDIRDEMREMCEINNLTLEIDHLRGDLAKRDAEIETLRKLWRTSMSANEHLRAEIESLNTGCTFEEAVCNANLAAAHALPIKMRGGATVVFKSDIWTVANNYEDKVKLMNADGDHYMFTFPCIERKNGLIVISSFRDATFSPSEVI